MTYRTCALIQARGGSQSIPKKNLLKIKGHSLIGWSITAFKFIESISDIFISTDSNELAQEAIRYGAKVPFMRPEHISRSNSQDIEVFHHFVNWSKTQNITYDLIVQVRPTTPARDPFVLRESLKYASKNFEKATSFRSVYPMSESSWKTFEMNGQYLSPLTNYLGLDSFSSNMPRQSFAKTFTANGYIDIVKPSQVLSGDLYGSKIIPIIVPDSGELDEPSDINYINYMVESNLAKFYPVINRMNSILGKI